MLRNIFTGFSVSGVTLFLIFTLLLGNILTGLTIVVGGFAFLLIGGLTNLKIKRKSD